MFIRSMRDVKEPTYHLKRVGHEVPGVVAVLCEWVQQRCPHMGLKVPFVKKKFFHLNLNHLNSFFFLVFLSPVFIVCRAVSMNLFLLFLHVLVALFPCIS